MSETILYIPDEKEPHKPILFLPGAPSSAKSISSSIAIFFASVLLIKVFDLFSKSPTLIYLIELMPKSAIYFFEPTSNPFSNKQILFRLILDLI